MTEAKKKRKGLTIECKIEQMTTRNNLGIDYLSSGDEIEHLAESS